MHRIPTIGLTAALSLFLSDQLLKWLVTGPLDIATLGDSRTITSFFNLRFVPNFGISLGLFVAQSDASRWLLVILTGAIACAVAVWMTRERDPVDQVALGLVFGGALGNILDRIRVGYVVDYADLHFGEWRPFLIFNLADAAITIGVLVLLARALFSRDNSRTTSMESPHA